MAMNHILKGLNPDKKVASNTDRRRVARSELPFSTQVFISEGLQIFSGSSFGLSPLRQFPHQEPPPSDTRIGAIRAMISTEINLSWIMEKLTNGTFEQ
jgi:hypothetical protein